MVLPDRIELWPTPPEPTKIQGFSRLPLEGCVTACVAVWKVRLSQVFVSTDNLM